MSYVITCGDEGVQINEGRRLGFVGAGFHLDSFHEAVIALKKVFSDDIRIVASEENDWVKQELNLTDWGQVNAASQQQVEALADREKLLYSGNLTFTDPKMLKHEIKGHMVRPHNIHVANKICLTLGGGEQKYNLGCYLISADWVSEAKPKVVQAVIQKQIEFYTALAKKPLTIVFEEGGDLDEKVIAKNKAALEKAGIVASPVVAKVAPKTAAKSKQT